MRNAHRTTASALRAASFAALAALVSTGVLAAAGGSTDIYAADGIAAAFGTHAERAAAPVLTATYSGSTDAWGVNGFRASFGRSDAPARSASSCLTGSTDIYGVRAFAASFDPAGPVTLAELAQACRSPAIVR